MGPFTSCNVTAFKVEYFNYTWRFNFCTCCFITWSLYNVSF